MDLTVARLRQNVNLIVNRVGRLTPAYLDAIKVIHDQERLAISSVAQVIVADASTLSVVPYDPSVST
jgi:ribosome recycling factor